MVVQPCHTQRAVVGVMAHPNLTASQLCNSALVEAFDRGAPINGCEVSNWYDIETNKDIYTFTFGNKDYLNNREMLRTPEIYARAWDEDMEANGLLFTVRLENIDHLPLNEVRKLIGDEVSAILFNLGAIRMAG
jgi:hypothetical protein